MSPLRMSRWTAVLALPLLVGALLLMHGLDAGAGGDQLHRAAAGPAVHPHDGDTPTEHQDVDDCGGCAAGHVLAVCITVLAAGVGLHRARRAIGAQLSTRVDSATGRLRTARRPGRPPDPAWVRLAVMRC